MLNPSHTCYRIPSRMDSVILGVHTDVQGPFAMALSRARCDQTCPMCTSIPSSKYSCRRVAAGCRTDYGSTPKVPRCLEATKAVREGDCARSSAVACAVAARVLTLGSPGGG